MSPALSSIKIKCPYPTPTPDNLASADNLKWHQLDSLCMIISNIIFSNLQKAYDKNNDLFSEKARETRDRYFNIVCSRTYSRIRASKMHRGKMEGNVLFGRTNSHFIAFLVASDDGITIVTADTNLGNILET